MIDAMDAAMIRVGGCSFAFHLPAKVKETPRLSSPQLPSSDVRCKSLSDRVSVVSMKDVFKAATRGQLFLFAILCLLLVFPGVIYYNKVLEPRTDVSGRSNSPVDAAKKDDEDETNIERISNPEPFLQFIREKGQLMTVHTRREISAAKCKTGPASFATHSKQASEMGKLPAMNMDEHQLNEKLEAIDTHLPDVVFNQMGDGGSPIPNDRDALMLLSPLFILPEVAEGSEIEIPNEQPVDGSFVFVVKGSRCKVQKMKSNEEMRPGEPVAVDVAAYDVTRKVTVHKPNEHGKIIVEQERVFRRC